MRKELTQEQKQEIVTRYKRGEMYKVMAVEMNIPSATIASYLRRFHPTLTKRKQAIHEDKIRIVSQKLVKKYSISDSKARSMAMASWEKFVNKKKNCSTNGKQFELAFLELEIPLVCPYLGIPINWDAWQARDDNAPSFDRVDNSLGYVAGNVIICSWRANRLKNDGTAVEHIAIAAFMQEFIEKKNA